MRGKNSHRFSIVPRASETALGMRRGERGRREENCHRCCYSVSYAVVERAGPSVPGSHSPSLRYRMGIRIRRGGRKNNSFGVIKLTDREIRRRGRSRRVEEKVMRRKRRR